MKMKHVLLSMILCLAVSGMACGIGSALGEMAEVGIELRREFGHDVSTGMSWDNNEKSWTISFTSYDLDGTPHAETKELAEDVHDFLLDEFRKCEDQDFVLIRFTPDDDYDDDTTEKVEFRFDH